MTLILLSVITVMAVAFLALTQRERIGVTQSSQQSDAEMVSEAGAERAKAEIFARYLAGNSNLVAGDLLVSRNYIRTNGFIVNDPVQPINTLNVNYDYRTDGQLLTFDEVIKNIGNLYYDPRVPVFVNTNIGNGPAIMDFRFFLDLNRNGRFETNGAYPIIVSNGRETTNEMHFVGDPEWVGVLADPRFPHSRTNRFIGRYAYIVLPIGKSLDINYIHNQGKALLPVSDPYYLRNQGFGSWELNAAAFLADLNTNIWNIPTDPYVYRTNLPPGAPPYQSEGAAFRNALEIYNARLSSFQNLAPAQTVLANPLPFLSDSIDAYANGPLDFTGSTLALDNDDPTTAWPGAYNWTNFFTPHDLFQIIRPRDLSANGLLDSFTNRLYGAGFATDSYDRYTFYRMLAQLSSDSAAELPHVNIQQLRAKIGASNPGEFVAEPAGKINLNYNNLNYLASEMVPWDTNLFFNTVADVLLRAQFNLTITNIPIFPTNYYGVTVHRLLQMAANIYDATSSNTFPSVFRPNVVQDGTNLYINGYYYADDARTVESDYLPRSHGMPMVIGAKKNLPNFNEYSAQTAVMAARKLEMRRRDTNSEPHMTNEMFIVGISNFFGVEAWNSYTQTLRMPVDIWLSNRVHLALTNSEGFQTNFFERFTNNLPGQMAFWPRFDRPTSPNDPLHRASFRAPLYASTIMLTNSIYRPAGTGPGTPGLQGLSANTVFTPNSGFRTPHWHLTVSNNLVFMLSVSNRIIDFVSFPNLTNQIVFARDLLGTSEVLPGETIIARSWETNRLRNPGSAPTTVNTPTAGIQAQIDISLGNPTVNPTAWKEFSFDTSDKDAGIRSFNEFVFPRLYPGNGNSNLIQQAPFTPARKLVMTVNWEANDPLVHYMEEHLKGLTNNYTPTFVRPSTGEMVTNQTLARINSRYEPWRGHPSKSPEPKDIDHRMKDPGVAQSDDWDFPTNKFPSVGWLGRVHRGTPWQTIYMKAEAAPNPEWRNFSLDPLSHPTNDWRLLDVFTVAIHPNASHGQLSINQTNFAAWSAVLSGVLVLTNIASSETYEAVKIEPSSPQLIAIFEGIQRTRDLMPDKTFRRMGDLLQVHELSQGSPFLDTNGVDVPYPAYGINDTAMERIAQQIGSLVKMGDPRWVIYSYGQSLRPAENSILTSGDYMGMCTNYQVTGEFVTRTVFQIEGTSGAPRPVVKAFNILSSD